MHAEYAKAREQLDDAIRTIGEAAISRANVVPGTSTHLFLQMFHVPMSPIFDSGPLPRMRIDGEGVEYRWEIEDGSEDRLRAKRATNLNALLGMTLALFLELGITDPPQGDLLRLAGYLAFKQELLDLPIGFLRRAHQQWRQTEGFYLPVRPHAEAVVITRGGVIWKGSGPSASTSLTRPGNGPGISEERSPPMATPKLVPRTANGGAHERQNGAPA